MTGTLITAGYFLKRIGEPDERETDLRFWSRLAAWQWQHEWREAEASGDRQRLRDLERQYEVMTGF